jgi:hypothetical protein
MKSYFTCEREGQLAYTISDEKFFDKKSLLDK